MPATNKKLNYIIEDIDLGDINETKKLSLLDEIGEVLTNRIIIRLIDEAPPEKKEVFIQKISEHKDEPNKVLLFIDHFIENADEVIDEEIDIYKNDLMLALDKTSIKS
jgi:hypothetical protein